MRELFPHWARLGRGGQVAKCIESYMRRGPALNLHVIRPGATAHLNSDLALVN